MVLTFLLLEFLKKIKNPLVMVTSIFIGIAHIHVDDEDMRRKKERGRGEI